MGKPADPATPTAPRKLRADAERNRGAILKAAEAVFRAQGAEAPIDEIARRAGVGVGTVYRNYPTKAAVVEAIIEARLGPIVAAARTAQKAEDPGEAFFAMLRRLAEEANAFKALAETVAAAGIDLRAAKEDLAKQVHAAMSDLLARAQRSGRVRPDVTIDDVTTLMGGLSHVGFGGSNKPARSRCVNLVCDALRSDRSAGAAAPAARVNAVAGGRSTAS
jgi:AcrR family transcriptional regulator